jgi:ring-1,2-phenylacetyl-CoA epoxidase subunit PaaC
MTTEARRPTRQVVQPDLPRFDRRDLEPDLRDALAELLLTMADDEFVIGFWDSEWTGIAPMLEEDVAFSSIAQDEIGHARLFYEMLAQLTGDGADRLAFGREAGDYRHAKLLDHPRTNWAFSVARKWIYETTDAVRLDALSGSAFAPLSEIVAKIRREERYHLAHLDAWLRRLAGSAGEPRERLESALAALLPDATSVFTPLAGEARLVEAGLIATPMHDLAQRWRAAVSGTLAGLGLPTPPGEPPPADGRDHEPPSEAFRWLWGEFTSVARLEEGAEW